MVHGAHSETNKEISSCYRIFQIFLVTSTRIIVTHDIGQYLIALEGRSRSKGSKSRSGRETVSTFYQERTSRAREPSGSAASTNRLECYLLKLTNCELPSRKVSRGDDNYGNEPAERQKLAMAWNEILK